jgi:hypothetical protein
MDHTCYSKVLIENTALRFFIEMNDKMFKSLP